VPDPDAGDGLVEYDACSDRARGERTGAAVRASVGEDGGADREQLPE
jgi:hypothetical protein